MCKAPSDSLGLLGTPWDSLGLLRTSFATSSYPVLRIAKLFFVQIFDLQSLRGTQISCAKLCFAIPSVCKGRKPLVCKARKSKICKGQALYRKGGTQRQLRSYIFLQCQREFINKVDRKGFARNETVLFFAQEIDKLRNNYL